MNGLKQALPNWCIQLTTELEFDIDYVEAAAFAWLAYRRMHNFQYRQAIYIHGIGIPLFSN